jgi:formylglycine-generating enzyme
MHDPGFLVKKMRSNDNVCRMQIVFADISAYSRRKSYAQIGTILALTECFKRAVEATAKSNSTQLAALDAHLRPNIVVLPTGDGVAVAFPFDSLLGLSMDFVDDLVTAIDAHNREQGECTEFYKNGFCDCHSLMYLRIGVSEGATVLYEDFNQRLNIAGNPVNMAARVMDLAEPGQVFLTEDAYRTLVDHIPGREQQFRAYSQAEIQHGIRIDVRQYTNEALAGLDVTVRAGLGLAEAETQPDVVEVEVVTESARSNPTPAGVGASSVGSPGGGHVGELSMVSVEDLGLSMGFDDSGQGDPYFSRPFLVSTRLVTQDDYQAVMGRNPSLFIGGSHPVEMVSWLDAAQFCNELSASHGFEPVYDVIDQMMVDADLARDGYRLPTEAEWEHCCRGESDADDRYGPIGEVAWYSANADGRTHPVCEKMPNRGVHDLLGNVWEWCGDWFQRGRPAARESDYVGPPTGYERVLRGGSWRDLPACVTAGYRHHAVPIKRESTVGFRVVRTLPTKPQS